MVTGLGLGLVSVMYMYTIDSVWHFLIYLADFCIKLNKEKILAM